MKYATILAFLVTTFLNSSLHAQSKTNRFDIEIDPIAFIFKGYSFHVGYNLQNFRFDAGTYAIDQPDFFLSDKKFSVYNRGIGGKIDYFLRRNKGVFFGIQSDYVNTKITLNADGKHEKTNDVTLGIRGGYRFLFGRNENNFRGLYLTPWIALINTPNTGNVTIGNETYREGSWTIFPTIHFGYLF